MQVEYEQSQTRRAFRQWYRCNREGEPMKGLCGSEMVLARPLRGSEWKVLFRATLDQEVTILFYTLVPRHLG